MSIVIVEGPDGAGKSTLIRHLRQESGRYFLILAYSGPPRNVQQIESVLRWIDQGSYLSAPIVCDRFPLISESIYGPLLRGRSMLDDMEDAGLRVATAVLRIAKIIYCRPPLDVIRTNLTKSDVPQLLGVLEHLHEIVDRYDKLMDHLSDDAEVYRYDYRSDATPIEEVFFK